MTGVNPRTTRSAMPRARSKDTRREEDRNRGPAEAVVQFRRGAFLHPEIEDRVSPGQGAAIVTKRDLKRYYLLLQAHRDALAFTSKELDQITNALRGMSFDDLHWVRSVPALLAEKLGRDHPVYRKVQHAPVADLYAVIDQAERRQLSRAKTGKL